MLHPFFMEGYEMMDKNNHTKNDELLLLRSLEEKLKLNSSSKFVVNTDTSYKKVAELNCVLLDFIDDLSKENSIDIGVIERLCKFYSNSVVYSLIPEDKQEMLVDYIELAQDYGENVSNNLIEIANIKYQERHKNKSHANCSVKTKLEQLKNNANKRQNNIIDEKIIEEFIKE